MKKNLLLTCTYLAALCLPITSVTAQPLVFEQACKTIEDQRSPKLKSANKAVRQSQKDAIRAARSLKGCLKKKALRKLIASVKQQGLQLRQSIGSSAGAQEVCPTSRCVTFSKKSFSKSLQKSRKKFTRALRKVERVAERKCDSSVNVLDSLSNDAFNDLLKGSFVYCSQADSPSLPLPKNAVLLYGPEDNDGDGLGTAAEFVLGTSPDSSDSDGDGTADGAEDSDGDGAPDGLEVVSGTNPLSNASPAAEGATDSDGDGLTLAHELLTGSLDSDIDTDDDGTADKIDLSGASEAERAAYAVSGAAPSGSSVTVTATDSNGTSAQGSATTDETGIWQTSLDLSSLQQGAVNVAVTTDTSEGAGRQNTYASEVTSQNAMDFAGTTTISSAHEVPIQTERDKALAEETALALSDGRIASVATVTEDGGTETDILMTIFSEDMSIEREFLINSTIPGNQADPSLGLRSDGSIVVVWIEATNSVKARVVNPDGTPVSDELTVLQNPLSFVGSVALTVTNDDGYTIVWQGPVDSVQEISLRSFSAAHAPITDEIAVSIHNDLSGDFFPQATTLANGNVLIGWRDRILSGPVVPSVRVMNPNGTPVTDVIEVGKATNGPEERLVEKVVAFENGNALLVMANQKSDVERLNSGGNGPAGWGTEIALLDSNGTELLAPTIVNQYPFDVEAAFGPGNHTSMGSNYSLAMIYSTGLGESESLYVTEIDQNGNIAAAQTVFPTDDPLILNLNQDNNTTLNISGPSVASALLKSASFEQALNVKDEQTTLSFDLDQTLFSTGDEGDKTFELIVSDAAGNPILQEQQEVTVYSDRSRVEETVLRAHDELPGNDLIRDALAISNDRVVTLTRLLNEDRGVELYFQVADTSTDTLLGTITRVAEGVGGSKGRFDLGELSNGEVIFAYQSTHTGSTISYTRRFNVDGTPTSSETPIVETGGSSQPEVLGLANGQYIACYTRSNNIFARVFGNDGVAAGDTEAINQTTSGQQQFCKLAQTANGRILAIWSSVGQDEADGGRGVYGRFFDQTLLATSDEFLINTTTAGNQANGLISANDDTFLVHWDFAGSTYSRRYSDAGVALDAAEVLLHQGNPAEIGLVLLSDGSVAISDFEGNDFPLATEPLYMRKSGTGNILSGPVSPNALKFASQRESFLVETSSGNVAMVTRNINTGVRNGATLILVEPDGTVVRPEYEARHFVE